ncbi:MAG: hypothetical protein SFU53_03045 [Terrimicrobiaceae bacterium]|nr:hypothetical protein [Terrimicrobiaceae bacterium]
MTPRAARQFLAAQHPDDFEHGRDCRRALAALEKSPELKNDLERQIALDRHWAARLHAVPVPEPAAEQLHASGRAAAAKRRRFSLGDPAILSALIGLVLLLGLLGWHLLGRAGAFPEEALTIAVDVVKLGPDQFEAVEDSAGALEDWFLLKGFEKFRIPPGFEKYEVAGARLSKVDNQPVAVLAVPENYMFFTVFDARPLGISLEPEGSWSFIEFDYRYAAAVREDKGVCFMVVIRGTRNQLEKILRSR